MTQYSSMYRFNSLEQSQETSNIIGLCAWSKHSSIMSSLCRCFSRPADPELLPATLSTTYTPVDPGQDDVDDVKDVVGDNEKTVNKQFASEPDFRRFCHHKDQSKPFKKKKKTIKKKDVAKKEKE
uniref:Bm9491 n=1 Tax=Brugia malayi TaxID=6279 RepID=A0A0I9N5B3_BRUMA|nr:Bm9491 [Brugia malayi]